MLGLKSFDGALAWDGTWADPDPAGPARRARQAALRYAYVACNPADISQVLPFLTAIRGQNHSGFSSSMVQGAQLFMNNFALQVGGGPGGGNNRVAQAEACDVACGLHCPRRLPHIVDAPY